MKKVVEAAQQQGWRTDITKKGVMLYSPDGKTQALIHHTPSDHRDRANTISNLRRGGFIWPWPPAGRRTK